jgi:hypothetical protein
MSVEIKGFALQGWGFPGLAKKAHYFQGALSLCGKWMFMGECTPETDVRSPDDCVACRKKLDSQNLVRRT